MNIVFHSQPGSRSRRPSRAFNSFRLESVFDCSSIERQRAGEREGERCNLLAACAYAYRSNEPLTPVEGRARHQQIRARHTCAYASAAVSTVNPNDLHTTGAGAGAVAARAKCRRNCFMLLASQRQTARARARASERGKSYELEAGIAWAWLRSRSSMPFKLADRTAYPGEAMATATATATATPTPSNGCKLHLTRAACSIKESLSPMSAFSILC